MAMTPAYALAHVFLPNLLKLKGHAAVVSAIERRDLAYFEPLWAQAHIAHRPHLTSQVRDPYRIATMSLPPPAEMGEAYIAAIVVKAADPAFMRYFTLEHDFVLAKQSNRTLLCEREGQKHNKRGDGPVLTGNPGDDAGAFVDCFMELMIPTKVTRK
ncbi:MAG: hypothetical protein E6J90_03440 [Deltaproteobacteria bacterium]|nr:MAG: hypothetical protein E6J91_18010 [Deltaproteobacteria bacterium]TMQ26991.1 MAG: hypothetical protein E6J90_03440 [Deltaproteobacteria bacterium]